VTEVVEGLVIVALQIYDINIISGVLSTSMLSLQANILKSIRHSSQRKRSDVDNDKLVVLNAWHRIDRRTREALRRGALLELIEGYEVCILQHFCKLEDLCPIH